MIDYFFNFIIIILLNLIKTSFIYYSTNVLPAADIVSDLSLKIIKTSCSRFNINRANVWDGAIRGFKRASYDPLHDMLVKFTDDEGTSEDAVDTGGPKPEFLTLLMDCLRPRRIFDGPENRRFLTFNNAGKLFT